MRTRWRVRVCSFVAIAAALMVAGIIARDRLTAQGTASTPPERHSIWVHPPEIGQTSESVRAFVERARRAHIETIIVLVKGVSGEIYWNSRRFSQSIAKRYESFDMLGELTTEAHRHGIKVHAWLCDFVEGANGAAIRAHPEWAALNPSGGATTMETLGPRRRPYPYLWMCPARRPGYTDQWLLPMIEELVRSYPIDGIHHDYVRYPGDVAPDSYCFCDYCLTNIPRYAMLAYETRPSERYSVDPRQEHIEANWWTDPTMVPRNWPERDRRERADFLLHGRTIPGGPPDVRYFFYDYRVAQIDRFVREAHELVKRINPKVELSAAVFKNPIQSARFIGQQWHRWNQWIDVYTPMTYRSHFAGSFDSYLDHLEETTRRQLEWIREGRPLEAGIATTYLYREELKPFDDMTSAIDVLRDLQQAGDRIAAANRQLNAAVYVLKGAAADTRQARDVALKQLSEAHDRLQTRLSDLDLGRANALAAIVSAVVKADEGAISPPLDELAKSLAALRADLPPGFCPPEKLAQAIDAARRTRAPGIAIFAASSVTREKLWPALEKALAQPIGAKR
jgi:uncharacterized lipoprotein YddW (UPF0748 family)